MSNIFETEYKSCSFCKRRLPGAYVKDVCPACEEKVLFAQVRDFIRSGDYNEFDVAEEFGIPRRKVREWIKDGRIEYKDSPDKKLPVNGGRCIFCAEPTSEGDICASCRARIQKKGYGMKKFKNENGEIRFAKFSEENIDY